MPLEQLTLDMPEQKIKNLSEGFICEKCGSYCKEYTRKFNSNMALCLVLLHRHKVNGFVKVEDFLLEHGQKRCGDFSYLVHYGFLEKQKVKREDGSKKNGYYRLTGRAILFLDGKITAAEKFKIYHNTFQGFAGKDITLKEALGVKFNYETLMNEN